MDSVDILVVGGGLAGLVVAEALRRSGVPHMILDRPSQAGRRLELLSGRALSLLADWPEFVLPAETFAPSCHITARWGGVESSRRAGQTSEVDRVVERTELRALLQRAYRRSGGRIRPVFGSMTLTRGEAGWLVAVTGEDAVAAKILVDATGAGATVSRRLGARRILHDRMVSRTRAAVCGPGAGGGLSVCACEHGWWSLLRSGRTSVECTLVSDRIGLGECPGPGCIGQDADFADLPPTAAAAVPIGALDRVGGPDWLAVGDAALALDPLCGHGLPTAITTASLAVTVLDRMLAGRTDGVEQYQKIVDADLRRHIDERQVYYDAEARGRTGAFWQRRPL